MAQSMTEYINGINKKNIELRVWNFNPRNWIEDFNEKDILKLLPTFIAKIKSFNKRTVDFDDVLQRVKSGELNKMREELNSIVED